MELRHDYIDVDTSLKNEFRAWLATQPADNGYDYSDNFNCAFAQFLAATSRFWKPDEQLALVGGDTWFELDIPHDLPDGVDDAVKAKPHTFGGVLERLIAASA